MARKLPRLDLQFGREVDKALALAEAAEQIKILSATGSIARKELPKSRLEAIYEIAYLRIFLLWEDLLEQSFLRYLCGFVPPSGAVSLIPPKYKTIGHAEKAVLGKRDFVSWANPNYVIKRSKTYFLKGPHEIVVASNLSRMGAFNAIRNRIAHSSAFARLQFDNATVSLVGHRYGGSSAGRFLRDAAVTSPTPQRWLAFIASELKLLALQVCS